MEKENSHGSLQKGLIIFPSATAMTRYNRTGITIYASGGDGFYDKRVLSGAGIISSEGNIIPDPTYREIGNSTITVGVRDRSGNSADLLVELGQPIDIVTSILQREMKLESEQLVLWNQGIVTPPKAPLYLVVSIPSTTIVSRSKRFEDIGGSFVCIQSVSSLDVVHVDISSRTTEALIRKMEPLVALTSPYSVEQQVDNRIKISATTRDVMNTIDLQPAYSPYRFRHAFILHSYIEYVSEISYYDKIGDPKLVIGD